MAAFSKTTTMSTGISAIIVGIGLITLGNQLDGFFKGLCQGAGVTLVLFGVYAASATRRAPKGSDPTWLPSRDGDR